MLQLRLLFPSSPAILLDFPFLRPFPERKSHLHIPLRQSVPRLIRLTSSCRCPCAASTAATGYDEEVVLGGFDEELRRLVMLLPPEMRRRVEAHPELRDLVEIVMDLGRQPLARFPSGDFFLSDRPISFEDLNHATSQVGEFTADNRAGISRTLHRISAIRNRKGTVIGLTCRVGRAVTGSANLLRDLVKDGGSLLIIGPPGVGKTTIIREIARMLADDYKRRVIIVDTSNEIGGDGDIPHAGIGSARRLQVPNPDLQHKVLIEAVENHMPQVIVIDEIGTRLEAAAASTIAQRGIQLVATAHGVTIENLIMNPLLEMLVGGIQSVTLGDEEASRRGVQKTVLERKGPSTFDCGAEIFSKLEIRVHRCLESTVDDLLAGRPPKFEVCKLDPKSKDNMLPLQIGSSYDVPEEDIKVEDHSLRPDETLSDNLSTVEEKPMERSYEANRAFHLLVYGIAETSVWQAVKQLKSEEIIEFTDNISEADALLALQSKLKKNSHIQSVAKSRDIPIFVTKTSSVTQITRALQVLLNEDFQGSNAWRANKKLHSFEEADALEEARLAIEQIVIPRGKSVQLLPRSLDILSAQIGLIERYKLKWEMVGQEPKSVKIFPSVANTKGSNLASQSGGEAEDISISDSTQLSENGIARLPFLPEW